MHTHTHTHKALLNDETAQLMTMQEQAKTMDGMYKECGANVPDGNQLIEFVAPVKQFVQANRMPAVFGSIDFEFSFDRLMSMEKYTDALQTMSGKTANGTVCTKLLEKTAVTLLQAVPVGKKKSHAAKQFTEFCVAMSGFSENSSFRCRSVAMECKKALPAVNYNSPDVSAKQLLESLSHLCPGYLDSSDAPVDTSNGSSFANMMAGTQGISIVKAAKEKMASRMKELTFDKELEEICEVLRGKSSLDISDAEWFSKTRATLNDLENRAPNTNKDLILQ